MNVAQDTREIDDRSHVCTVESSARERRRADGSDEVRIRTGRERRHHGLAVPIIQNKIAGILRKTGGLLVQRPLKALLINANSQRASQESGTLVQGLGVNV